MKIERIDLVEAGQMADSLIEVLKTYEPTKPTLAFAAVLLCAGRFMASQIELGAPIQQVGADAFDVIIDECLRVAGDGEI